MYFSGTSCSVARIPEQRLKPFRLHRVFPGSARSFPLVDLLQVHERRSAAGPAGHSTSVQSGKKGFNSDAKQWEDGEHFVTKTKPKTLVAVDCNLPVNTL